MTREFLEVLIVNERTIFNKKNKKTRNTTIIIREKHPGVNKNRNNQASGNGTGIPGIIIKRSCVHNESFDHQIVRVRKFLMSHKINKISVTK